MVLSILILQTLVDYEFNTLTNYNSYYLFFCISIIISIVTSILFVFYKYKTIRFFKYINLINKHRSVIKEMGYITTPSIIFVMIVF